MSTIKELPKRDFLVSLEKKYQLDWESQKLHEIDPVPGKPKYMSTFPYPYMNGKLHMGHSFSVSKPEFQTRYQRMLGKEALFPMGFHCTGMPIKAAADKIKREIEMFGTEFIVPENQKTDGSFQFEILLSSGIPKSEIPKFQDPKHWIYYFPPLAINDIKRLGCHVDWRRSFITTDVNPYYDSFIQWQFNQLYKMVPSKIQFGERYTIYSPLDGQACMDHDRKTGEGVGVQEYTGIKLKILMNEIQSEDVFGTVVGKKLLDDTFKKAVGNLEVYMVAATLRPETMYGQTNCFVGVDLDYGVFQVSETEAWICTSRAARNMSYQNLFQEKGRVIKLFDLKGIDLIGIPVLAPLSFYEKVYVLPMDGVLANKGTGVVTSVPSDSPDDYITMMDLAKKSEYFKVKSEWVKPFLPPKPIIQTPKYGNLAAVTCCETLKIASQKDKEKLSQAKEMAYKEGFYNGTIIVGNFSGKPVQEVKPLIRQNLIDRELAFAYSEPEGKVISRSGDECVVALVSQWYMDYGEEEWKKLALECLNQMELFMPETRNGFEKNLEWLKQWACSRSYGLGSRLPWDREWLIESLSDSTIYMAYYTVAHILHEGTLDGSKPSTFNIQPSDMNDEVWSYIMIGGPEPKDSKIPKQLLEKMRAELEYFYPLDLRTSAKDLINNHLTFFIYNHVAIFPKRHWPRGVRVNGYLLLNNEKMSKSTGNFMNMCDSLERYGADATRFALADSGDGLDDANFVEKTADDAVLKLYTELEWLRETLNDENLRTGEYNWNDKVLDAELNLLVEQARKAYDNMLYREVLKVAFYDLQNARNEYRKVTTGQGLGLDNENWAGLHHGMVVKFAELQALLMSPITPHWSDCIWREILKKPATIIKERFPTSQSVDESVIAASNYIRSLTTHIRATEELSNKRKKKKQAVGEIQGPQKLELYVADKFPDWQTQAIEVLKETWTAAKGFDDTEVQKMKERGLLKNKKIMPFVATIKKNVSEKGPSAFDRTLLFDEHQVLDQNLDLLRRELVKLKISKVIVRNAGECEDAAKKEKVEAASEPGQPAFFTVADN